MTQHDDHIWLTLLGEAWAIRAIEGDIIWLWRGYQPDIEHMSVHWPKYSHVASAEKAAAWLKDGLVKTRGTLKAR